MSSCTVRRQQHGPNLKATLLVMRFESDSTEIRSNTFYIDTCSEATAIVYATMHPVHRNETCLQVNIKVRSSNTLGGYRKPTKNVSLNIVTEGFDKQFLCQDHWMEIQSVIKAKKYETFVQKNEKVFLYTIEIFFFVHVPAHEEAANVYSELYQEIEFTDFKLRAADGTVPVHKSILFIHSEMFRAMLNGKWKETGEGSIDMVGVTVETLQHLKEYMYLGTIPNKGLEPLLLLARRCLMDKLAAGCIAKLVKQADSFSFKALFDLAFENNMPELMKALIENPNKLQF